MARFNDAVEIVIQEEGGYVFDPDDRGGETKYGISKKQYPNVDIKNLRKSDAEEIYRLDYWGKLRLDEVANQILTTVLFDFGVNAGVAKAAKMVQRLVSVKIDGKIGPVSLHAINKADPSLLVLKFTCARIGYYAEITAHRKANKKYLVGWVNRALAVAGELKGS